MRQEAKTGPPALHLFGNRRDERAQYAFKCSSGAQHRPIIPMVVHLECARQTPVDMAVIETHVDMAAKELDQVRPVYTKSLSVCMIVYAFW